uniref:Protein kinase domain-containing protein n=1 Tax=Macrostomum lignano TaxID=282301 RepID=A0A1I8HQZ0_9PLAT
QLTIVCLLLASSVAARPTGTGHRMVLDRSIRLLFECPSQHGNEFAVQYLPKVWQRVNSSLAELSHQMAACDQTFNSSPSTPACLAASDSESTTEASVYLVRLDLLTPAGELADPANRAAFQQEALDFEPASQSARLRRLRQLQVAEARWQPSHPTVVFVAFVAFTALAAVVLVKRQRVKEQQRQQQQQECTSDGATSCEPQVQLRRDQQQQQQQPKSETTVELELQPMQAHTAASWIVRPPLPAGPRLSSMGWLNLAYNPDYDDSDFTAMKGDDEANGALPSRVTRFRAVGDVDEAEARRQFSRLGSPAGGSDAASAATAAAFYWVGDASSQPGQTGLSFVLADASGHGDNDNERFLELLWACGGAAVSLDPGFVGWLESRSTTSTSSSRFYLTGWARSSFPCHSVTTATMHCLDSNLSKRIRVCQLAGGLSRSPDSSPASPAEFVRFAHACAANQPTTSATPTAAIGRGLSEASLLPLLLLAAKRTRLTDAGGGGGVASCDLLRLAAGLRRQCPLAVANEAHYLFVMRCLHAYACLVEIQQQPSVLEAASSAAARAQTLRNSSMPSRSAPAKSNARRTRLSSRLMPAAEKMPDICEGNAIAKTDLLRRSRRFEIVLKHAVRREDARIEAGGRVALVAVGPPIRHAAHGRGRSTRRFGERAAPRCLEFACRSPTGSGRLKVDKLFEQRVVQRNAHLSAGGANVVSAQLAGAGLVIESERVFKIFEALVVHSFQLGAQRGDQSTAPVLAAKEMLGRPTVQQVADSVGIGLVQDAETAAGLFSGQQGLVRHQVFASLAASVASSIGVADGLSSSPAEPTGRVGRDAERGVVFVQILRQQAHLSAVGAPAERSLLGVHLSGFKAVHESLLVEG